MNKKAWISSFMAAAMLAGSCAGFAGCKKDEDKTAVTDPDKVDENTKLEDIVSEKISEDDWKSATAEAALQNVTCKSESITSGVGYSYGNSQREEADGGKLHVEDTETSAFGGMQKVETSEYFFEKSGSNYYKYSSGFGGMYTKEDETEDNYNAWSVSKTIKDMTTEFSYADLKYDEEKKGYVVSVNKELETENGGGISPRVSDVEASPTVMHITGTIKLLKGKLISMEYDTSYTQGETETSSGKSSILFYHYGTTKVTLPSNTTPTYEDYLAAEGQAAPDAAAWNGAVKAEDAKNVVCLEMQVINPKNNPYVSGWNWTAFAGGKVLKHTSDGEKVYEKDGSKYYAYEASSDELFTLRIEGNENSWKGDWGCENPLDEYLGDYREVSADAFGTLSNTYNAEKHAYVVEGVEVKVVGGKVQYICDTNRDKLYYFYNYGSASVKTPAVVTSQEMTDDGWTAAMNAMKNFKITQYYSGYPGDVMEFDGEKTYASSYYYDWTEYDGNGTARCYSPKTGEGVGEDEYEYKDGSYYPLTLRGATFGTFKKSEFTFTNGAYVGGSQRGGTTLYFKDGKLYLMTMEQDYGTMIMVIVLYFHDYGKASVTLPTNATPAPAEND